MAIGSARPEVFGVRQGGEPREQACDDLVAWIERGIRPDGEDVLASDMSRIGLKWTPILHVEDPVAGRR